MKPEKIETPESERNEDPITHEAGAHPLSTGVGAAGAGTIGVAIGTAVGGPIGGLIGAAVGALVGGLGGSAVGEAIDPTTPVAPVEETAPAEPIDDLVPSAPSSIDRDLTSFVGVNPVDLQPKADEIAQRAWDIWAFEGFPENRDVENWLQAEKELIVQSKADA